jgi:phosphatidylglycerophosphate synthase
MTAGEAWARDELLALRAAGFRPATCNRFLAASFARAADTRRARPALTRQARAWSAAALLAGHAARRAAHSRGIAAPSGRAWTAWSVAIAAMLDWHLGMLEGPRGEPRQRLGAADALALTRASLAPFVASTRDGASFTALLALAAASDYLDGRLARRSGPTRLGGALDTSADVAVKLAAARAARRAGWLTPATAALLAGCQAGGVAAVAATYFRTGRPPAGGSIGPARWTAPALLGGLAVAPRTPRAANGVVGAASLATFIVAPVRRGLTGTREHDVLGSPRRWQRAPAADPRLAQPQPRRTGGAPRAVPHAERVDHMGPDGDWDLSRHRGRWGLKARCARER